MNTIGGKIIAVTIFLLFNLFCDSSEKRRPNILIILADDIGFSDIGCYGSEIKTPNLDKLAEKGMRFRQFYNGAKCEPSRNSLFTGLYYGDDRAISFEGLLHDNGYGVIHSGKEHFESWVPERCFAANCSDHSFTFWAATNFFIPPDSTFSQPLFLDKNEINPGELEKITGKPFYMTDFITDMGINWLDDVLGKDKPFLLVLPYNAAHWPLQAWPEDIAKYRDLYRQGWDKIRAARFAKMQKLGVVPENIKLSTPEPDPTLKIKPFQPRNDGCDDVRKLMSVYTPWKELTAEQQDAFSLEESVFAAMIDRMDQNIGRVLEKIKTAGEEDNTIVMFFSDNGACPFERNRDLSIPPGGADSYRTQSTPWANVGNTPFRLYKQNGHEGGSHNHFIATWPGVIKPGTISDARTHIVDIFPTLLDLSGISYPAEIGGEPSIPLHGTSLLPVFKGENRKEPEFILSGFSEAKRMFLKGDYKIVKNIGEWEMYNLKTDPSEETDLAKSDSELLNSMIQSYHEAKQTINSTLKNEPRFVDYPYRNPVSSNQNRKDYSQYRK
ncbi:arylsulfatase [Maribellus luteus]|uniref:Arylsulfatase n=1 Tax=Maribellus luteus TaxID=2305463 RepID=A0A399TA17_9BACT|nr:arylsulfatase [Maribellus luteus]RIJ50803.1 arylsulfatase [Maribellus luteus]